MPKAQTFDKLKALLDGVPIEKVLEMLADYMDGKDYEGFYEHVKKEMS